MKEKIKICFEAIAAYPLFDTSSKIVYGGAELQLYLIAKELAKDSCFEVSFITGNFDNPEFKKYKNISVYPRIKVYPVHSYYQKLKQIYGYFKTLKNIDADFYISSSSEDLAGFISIFCKLNNKKSIHRVSSDMDIEKKSLLHKGLKGKIYKYGLKHSDVVIVQSKNQQDLLRINYNKNSFPIQNSFEIPPKIKIKKDNSILWVSRFDFMKKPEIFLDLARNFPKEKFIMICPNGKKESEKDYLRFISESKKTKNIKFIKKVPFDKIQKYFDEAKILVNTSDFEGFPNTFIQAGIGGTPIVSLNVNPDNFLNKYKCGFCANGNLELMKKQLKRLLREDKLRKKMGENAYNYVKNNHDIKKNVKQIKKVILDLVKK